MEVAIAHPTRHGCAVVAVVLLGSVGVVPQTEPSGENMNCVPYGLLSEKERNSSVWCDRTCHGWVSWSCVCVCLVVSRFTHRVVT